jgi:hypothetical protein
VTDWALIPSVTLTRADIMTTIREPSAGTIDVVMDIPIDANCRIEVKFPADMPLTSDLT